MNIYIYIHIYIYIRFYPMWNPELRNPELGAPRRGCSGQRPRQWSSGTSEAPGLGALLGDPRGVCSSNVVPFWLWPIFFLGTVIYFGYGLFFASGL